MSTLKSPLSRESDAPHVHQRPRKHPPRCTLDCGFKTPESPALRGFVAERAPIRGTSLYLVLKSNGLRRPKIRLKKFGFSLKTFLANIVKKLPPQRCSKPLFIPIFNFSHKWPTFAFTGESGYTLGSRRKIAHSGLHAETGAFRTGPLSLPSERSARSQASPGRVSERRTLPLWDLGREVLSKNAESLRDSDALMRVAAPRRRGPAGLRNLFPLLLKLHFCAPHPGLSTLARCGGVTTALGMLGALPKCSVRRFQSGLHLLPQSGVGITYLPFLKESHTTSHTLKERAFLLRPQLSSDLPSDFYKYVNCINNSARKFCCNCFCCMVR